MAYKYIIPIDTKTAFLEVIGGKGKSLARMVPKSDMFIVPTIYKIAFFVLLSSQ